MPSTASEFVARGASRQEARRRAASRWRPPRVTPMATALYCAGSTTMATRLLVSCGETSGDLYGGELVRHLRARMGEITVFGLGGDHLAAEGTHLLAHVRELGVVGLLEVVRHLRRLHAIYRSVLAEVERDRPALAVLIDYPDFNLRLARALRRRGVRVAYYVSPQVWAWRRGRLRVIAETVSHMVVIFPFEEALYRNAGVPVTFVGHPLVDLVRPPADRAAFLTSLGLAPDRPMVAVLPGSRAQEAAHNLPPLAGALRLLAVRRPDLQFTLAVAPALDAGSLLPALGELSVVPVKGQAHAVLGSATLALVASGTATVEAALLRTPMVVVYRLSPLTYALGRPFVRVPRFAMANLIAGREVVKELIQNEFTPEAVSREALTLLDDPARLARLRDDLRVVGQRLGPPGASVRAADVVARLIEEQKLDRTVGYM